MSDFLVSISEFYISEVNTVSVTDWEKRVRGVNDIYLEFEGQFRNHLKDPIVK